jgi:hypothetical protein
VTNLITILSPFHNWCTFFIRTFNLKLMARTALGQTGNRHRLKLYRVSILWTRKSKHRGRPTISHKTIALIKRIHQENPLWSPERIHDQLINLGIIDVPAPNTIAKYLSSIRKPPSEKSWQSCKTFLVNHHKGIWAMDFLTVPTIFFKVLYVLIIINYDRRVMQHVAVTSHPTSAWVGQRLLMGCNPNI